MTRIHFAEKTGMTNPNRTERKKPDVAREPSDSSDVTYLTFIEHPEQDRREGERRSGHDRRQPTP